MADLTDTESAQTIKLVGATGTGTEANFANVSATNQVKVDDSINTAMVSGAITVTTSAAEAKVGGSALSNRKFITVTPTGGTIYWGATSGVTTANGTPIFKNQTAHFALTAAVPLYLIAGSATDVRIAEGS